MNPLDSDEALVKRAVQRAFEVGKSKDLQSIHTMHLNDQRFSKFNDNPPYNRLDYNETCMHEELFFAGISDYDFRIDDLKVDIFGDTAIATFLVEHSGMLVDDYSFTGRTMKITSRGTMIFQKKDLDWLIVHEHFSKMPTA